jgi:hypothetical protein
VVAPTRDGPLRASNAPVTQRCAVSYPPLYPALSVTTSPAGPVTTGAVAVVAAADRIVDSPNTVADLLRPS